MSKEEQVLNELDELCNDQRNLKEQAQALVFTHNEDYNERQFELIQGFLKNHNLLEQALKILRDDDQLQALGNGRYHAQKDLIRVQTVLSANERKRESVKEKIAKAKTRTYEKRPVV